MTSSTHHCIAAMWELIFAAANQWYPRRGRNFTKQSFRRRRHCWTDFGGAGGYPIAGANQNHGKWQQQPMTMGFGQLPHQEGGGVSQIQQQRFSQPGLVNPFHQQQQNAMIGGNPIGMLQHKCGGSLVVAN